MMDNSNKTFRSFYYYNFFSPLAGLADIQVREGLYAPDFKAVIIVIIIRLCGRQRHPPPGGLRPGTATTTTRSY